MLAFVASSLSWDVAELTYADSFDVPLELLWDEHARGGFELGIPLVIVAAVATLFSVTAMEPFVFLRRLGGLVLLAAVAMFVVQLGRRVGWDNLDVGIGPYLAGAGGLLLLLAPSGPWPVAGRRLRRTPAQLSAAAPPPPPEEAPPPMPPGWYADPQRAGQRYWDGENWTEHRAR